MRSYVALERSRQNCRCVHVKLYYFSVTFLHICGLFYDRLSVCSIDIMLQ